MDETETIRKRQLLKQLIANLGTAENLLEEHIKFNEPEIAVDPKFLVLRGYLAMLGSSIEDLKLYDANYE